MGWNLFTQQMSSLPTTRDIVGIQILSLASRNLESSGKKQRGKNVSWGMIGYERRLVRKMRKRWCLAREVCDNTSIVDEM